MTWLGYPGVVDLKPDTSFCGATLTELAGWRSSRNEVFVPPDDIYQ